jgi:predicted ArsR family transcriptional regulator
MTRTQARAFQKRWRQVARAERIAQRRASLDERLHRLAALMASTGVVGGHRRLAAEDAAVRRRWARLRLSTRG